MGGHRADGDRAAGARVLGDDAGPVRVELGEREPGPGHVVLPEERVVAAGGLRAALQHVPRHHGTRERVQVPGTPAEVGDGRADHQRRVGDPPGDHHVRPAAQALRDPERPQIGIGRQQPAGESEFLVARQQIVTLDMPDGRVQPLALRQLPHRVGQSRGVQPARVDHDPHPALQREAEALLQLPQKGLRVAERGVLQPVPRQDQHRQLGQVVPGEHVQRPTGEHLPHRREPVPVEPRGIPDPQHRRAVTRPGLRPHSHAYPQRWPNDRRR